MELTTTLLATLAAGLVSASSACDCLYHFTITGKLTSDCGLDQPQARACFDDACLMWREIDSEGSFEYWAGGNGSECERPSRIEFRAKGTAVVAVTPTSDRVETDVHLTCPTSNNRR